MVSPVVWLSSSRTQMGEADIVSGRHSFSELTRDFTPERRRRIAEMKVELLAETPEHDLHRGHLGIREVDPDISPRT